MSSLDVPVWAWALLALVLAISITIDLFAHRGDHPDSRRRALVWSAAWIGVAVTFGLFVTVHFGAVAGEEFFAAYLLEKSLSVDNLFVFLLVFGALGIPESEQRRVLTWGIAGALILRGVLIFAGAAAVHEWHWLTYGFGGILLLAAWKLAREPAATQDSKLLRWLERHLPWTPQLHGHSFITRIRGRRVATPLLLALIAIELTDVVFAIDSIPAAFAVTEDTFVLYSSNMLALLGLRALYVVLASALAKLRYLRIGLAGVLAFAGAKLVAAPWVSIAPLVSIAIIAAILTIAVGASLRVAPRGGSPHV